MKILDDDDETDDVDGSESPASIAAIETQASTGACVPSKMARLVLLLHQAAASGRSQSVAHGIYTTDDGAGRFLADGEACLYASSPSFRPSRIDYV